MAELLLAAASAWLGFACLALSQPQHWRAVTAEAQAAPPRPALLRPAGYLALALALALCLARDGVSFGSILWVLLLAVDAALVVFTLSWRPRWLAAAVRLLGRG